MSGHDLEKVVIRPVLKVAEQNPMMFIELVLRQATKSPEGVEMVVATIRAMGEWYDTQTAGLEGVLRLQQIVASGGRQ